jgi:hypothetical protein
MKKNKSEDGELTDEDTPLMTKRSRTTSDGKLVEQLRAEIRKLEEHIAQQKAYIESLGTKNRPAQL